MLQRSCTEESRLTVLHLVQPVEGGVARVVTDLVAAQVRAGLRPVVACPPDGWLATGAAEAGARVWAWPAERVPGPRLGGEVALASRLVRACAPDVIHAHSAKAGLAGRLAVRGRVPTVFQPHAWSFEALEGRAAGLATTWERFGARWSDRIVCVSESERRAGQRAGIAGRWSVIRNGVDLGRFRPVSPEAARSARAGLGLLADVPAGAPLAVCVGRLSRQKGQDVLLRAWRRVRVPGARLVLVGDGPCGGELRRAAPEGVLFAGACGDVRPWIHAADVLVLPSRWEGMALAPLEAMACGRPVLLSDVDGARESLPPGQVPHCLVPPEDPAALASALTALLGDPALRAGLGDAAQAHARSAFDLTRTSRAVLRLYQELVDQSRPTTRERTER
ncbi:MULTISPECIES: glycosyltransferase [Streptomyces]|uniref:Glycosyltransferase n=2 Tax=Streptomyces TaxID=1883 RepID=A0ABU2RLE8_9ACTN|nr:MULTISPECIES: glycosyltransferase [unclassified Streptomyces]MBK3592266.1 glycosyltransferase [Streptomyces sp. MBT51]MDT0429315.1 glycosyltransferase [Streptomyces sp. DSM 41770]